MRNLKKLLAVIVAICILATMAIPAFAAGSFTYETQAKSLYDMKLFMGNSASQYVPALDGSLTREQGIILLVRLFGKDADAKALTGADAALAAYTDKAKVAPWAKNYVAYAVKTGMVKGETATTVNPQGKLVGNAFSTMILRNLGYKVDDAASYAAASATLQEKGGTLTADQAKAFASKELIRDDACGIMFSALLAKDTAGKTAIENLIAAGVVTEAQAAAAGLFASATAKVVDVNKVQVSFTSAVDSAKVKVVLKQGLAIQYTTAAFAADNKSVVLTAPVAIPAGDYTVVISGLKAADVTLPITVGTATPAAIEVTNTQVAIGVNSKVSFSVTNQYGTDMGIFGSNPELIVTAFDTTSNTSVTVDKASLDAASKSVCYLDLSNTTYNKVGDDVRIMVSYKGLTVSKTVKVVAQASVSSIELGTVVPLTGTTRITAGDKLLVLPYTLKDQYGNTATLPAGAVNTNNSSVTFVSSDNSVISPSTFAVDANGKLTFTAAGAGTTTITALINASGAVSKTTVTVSKAAALSAVSIASPTALLAVGETAKLALTGVDQFGAISTDFSTAKVLSSDDTIATGTIVSGKLVVTASKAGTVTLKIVNTTDSSVVYGSIAVRYEAAAVPTAIVGLKTATTFEVGATQSIALSDILVKDQYGRDYTLKANSDVTITETDSNTTVTLAAVATTGGYTTTAATDAGSEVIKFTLKQNGASYSTTYSVVATSSIVSYAVTGAKTVYADTTSGTSYELALGVEGKLADGTKVVLAAGKITNATSSTLAVATVTSAGVVNGLSKGTTTITLWSGATELANTVITVDDAAPRATTVAFDASEYTVTKGSTIDLGKALTVSDQYGVSLANNGFWATTDSSVATVTTAGVVSGVKAGQATIKFITSNGIVTTVNVTVE